VTVVDSIRERAAAAPNHPALVSDVGDGASTVVSYGELVARFEDLAARFRADGLRGGDRCGLAAPAGVDFIESALGILSAGGCLVPVADEHRGEAFDTFAEAARLQCVVSADVTDATECRLEKVLSPALMEAEVEAEFRALEPAFLRFTSGTTNERKGVVIGHAAVLQRTAAANRALQIDASDRVLWQLPMAHHFVVSILLYLRFGATILLPAGSLARPTLEFANRERATVLYASPHHYGLLGKDASEIALSSVRLAVSTAEGLRREIAEKFADRFGIPIAQALGIIEVGLPVANFASAAAKPLALGRPLPDFEVWLRDSDGRPLKGATTPERTGEICIRGPGLFDAYLDPWAASSSVLLPDGFRTGDQGFFDADGDLHMTGRRVNRICMAGMKFFGEEVEAVLDTHPAVRESRVFARVHAHLGEIPVAEVVPERDDAPPSRGELAEHCRASLPGYKVPREFRMVPSLPRTVTGKVQRTVTDAANSAPATSR